MPFATYASLGDVARAYQITLRDEGFVVPLPRPVGDILRGELAFAEGYVAFDSSEFAVCENLIYPVLKDVWRSYTDSLMVWSHMPLSYDADLCGTPDYYVAKKSHLGRWVEDKPYLIVVEAKKDDFTRGWGQCLAAMLAAQKLNDLPEQTLYGVTTNGRVWEFGKLYNTTLTRDPRPFLLHDLEELCAALHYLFEQCRQQLVTEPCPA